jgi:crossover junction endodeoxyribonuclease RuvC
MVKMLLSLEDRAQSDAADALAAAICHGHTRHSLAQIRAAAGMRLGQLP